MQGKLIPFVLARILQRRLKHVQIRVLVPACWRVCPDQPWGLRSQPQHLRSSSGPVHRAQAGLGLWTRQAWVAERFPPGIEPRGGVPSWTGESGPHG